MLGLTLAPRRLAALVLTLVSSLACLEAYAATAEPPSSDAGIIVAIHPADGRTFVNTIPKEAIAPLPPALISPAEGVTPASPESKLHPELAEKLRSDPPQQIEDLVISFRDHLRIPRFPKPILGQPHNSPENQAAQAEAARLIEQVRASRQPVYTARAQEMALFAEVIETFWLIDAMRVRMPLWVVTEIARREDVLYIEPSQTRTPPPDSNPNNDVADARAYIRSEVLYNIWSDDYVGLLDTGVRATHTLLSNPSPLRHVRDCVNGTSNNCTTGANLNPDDNCWNHGTSTAAIITGNSTLGNDYRGVDWVTLDSFKVYPGSPCDGLNTNAVIRGFQAALAVLDQVIVAEMQGLGSDSSSISLAADNAYDAGAVVVAANGNYGPAASTVRTPANAHKVIGVGAFDLQTLAQSSDQSRGPAPDGRIKPDIQSPTNTETASTASSTALQVFSGTSGATPYASALATQLRTWLGHQSGYPGLLPGAAYAWMILMGGNIYPAIDNTSGAGHARFVDGLLWKGKVTLTGGTQTDLPLDGFGWESGYPYNLTAAIWWPEAVTDVHNDIDLHIVDPGGVVRASSTLTTSIFERTRVPGLLATGTWKLRVQNKGSRTQDVFFGAYRTSS